MRSFYLGREPSPTNPFERMDDVPASANSYLNQNIEYVAHSMNPFDILEDGKTEKVYTEQQVKEDLETEDDE
jgi:hypothetical protein